MTSFTTSDKVPGFEENGLSWSDDETTVIISMPIKPDVLRSLSVYTDGENVTLTWQNDSVRGRASHCPRARARARRRRLLSCPERPQDLRANPAQ